MDIGSKRGYPSASLSNFAPHEFYMEGIYCASMEGFLQSLKFENPEVQKEVCKLVGLKAKYKGKHKKWWKTHKLYWKGIEYDRFSGEYQLLLDKAFSELSKNNSFRKALLATQNSNLTHTIGKRKESETILTRSEFCSRLLKLRRLINGYTSKSGCFCK